MAQLIPLNSDTAGKIRRFLREDLRYWFSQPNKKPFLVQTREAIEMWRAYRFFPYQYFKHDLYLSDVGPEYLNYIPSIIADQCVTDVNPAECEDWTEDKIAFEARMKSAEIPIVPTLATLKIEESELRAFDLQGRPLALLDMFALFKNSLLDCVFIKPRFGGQGIGAHRLDIGEANFVKNGKPIELDALRPLLEASGFREFLVQPFFSQHEILEQLNPSSINTLRVVTLLTGGEFEVIGSMLRVGSGSADTDNWSGGGFVVNVDLHTGAVAPVAKVKLSYSPQRRAIRHPISKLEFGSIRVPYTDEVLSMVHRAAKSLAPIRLVGWDIAIGKDGPCVIEANFLGGFLPLQDACGGLRHTGYGRELASRFNWR